MIKFNCGCRTYQLEQWWFQKAVLELLAQDLRECLWEVLQETNEIPIYMENKSMEMEKQRMDMFMNYEEEEDNFYEECK